MAGAAAAAASTKYLHLPDPAKVANRQPLVLSRRAPASSSSSTSPLAVLDLCLSALPPTTPDCLPRRVHSAQRPSSVSGARLAAQLRCVRRRGSHARTRPPAWASSPSRTVGDVVQLQRAASAPVRCSRTPRAPPGLGDETERIALPATSVKSEQPRQPTRLVDQHASWPLFAIESPHFAQRLLPSRSWATVKENPST